MTCTFSVSIVTYSPALPMLSGTLRSLGDALRLAKEAGAIDTCQLFLIDNGPGNGWEAPLRQAADSMARNLPYLEFHVLSGHGNVGYGQGHNLAIATTRTDYHLILNPDVVLRRGAITIALGFMAQHPDVGLLAPSAEDESGARQFLCKRYPALLDLALRAFAPAWGKKMFRERLARYEMLDCYSEDATPFDVPIASGCFMFCRRQALESTGGFARQYFMYFEDFDLSLRIGRQARVVCVPAVQIVHFGGHAAKKGVRHVLMFVKSGLTFFREHGWKLA